MFSVLSKISKSVSLGYRFMSSQHRFTLLSYQFSRKFSTQPSSINKLLSQLKQAEKANDNEALLLIYKELGAAYMEKRDTLQSLIWWENYAKLAESIQGINSPKLDTVLTMLGYNFNALGNPEKSIEYYEKASKIQTIKYGEQSQEVAETFTNLASGYILIEETEKAEQALNKASNYMKKHEWSTYLPAAAYFLYCGHVASKKNEFQKSIENFTKSFIIYKLKYGHYNIEGARIFELMANNHLKLNDKEKASSNLKSAIDVRDFLWVHDINLYTQLISLLVDLKKDNKRDEYIEKAIKAIHKKREPITVTLANFYIELGQKFQEVNDLEMSSKFLAKAIEALEKLSYHNTKTFATLYEKISSSLAKTQEYEKIISCLQKALKIKAHLRMPQESLASNWYSLGKAYLELKDYEKSERYLLQAKEIFEYGNSDKIALADCLNALSILYRDTQEFASSADLLKRVIEIKCEVLGQNYPDLAREYGELGIIYKLWGKTTEDLESFWAGVEINNKTLGKDNSHNAERR